jgi:hypothetical protein
MIYSMYVILGVLRILFWMESCPMYRTCVYFKFQMPYEYVQNNQKSFINDHHHVIAAGGWYMSDDTRQYPPEGANSSPRALAIPSPCIHAAMIPVP